MKVLQTETREMLAADSEMTSGVRQVASRKRGDLENNAEVNHLGVANEYFKKF
jgi:hypothetical protein